MQFAATLDGRPLAEAIAAYDEARRDEASLIRPRGEAARRWALLNGMADPAAGVEGARFAFNLLAALDWQGLSVDDRLALVGEWRGFAATAAAWALEMNDPEQATALLEQGRGLLWSQLTDSGFELERLDVADQELAAR